jgi:hypothetical protein
VEKEEELGEFQGKKREREQESKRARERGI